jgi:hypothetical protein
MTPTRPAVLVKAGWLAATAPRYRPDRQTAEELLSLVVGSR